MILYGKGYLTGCVSGRFPSFLTGQYCLVLNKTFSFVAICILQRRSGGGQDYTKREVSGRGFLDL